MSGLAAAVAIGAVVTLSTEVLSLSGGLTRQNVTLVWLAIAVIAVVLLWRQRTSLSRPSLPTRPIDRVLMGGVAVLVAVLGCVALVVPPNTWDALVYHVPRIMHWAQQGSVAHYDTTIARQLYQPPGASFVLLHLYLLAQGDRLTNLVQWTSMIGALAGVAVLTARLGGSGRAQVLAVVVAATIPIGVLQATTTQNDYVGAFWLICLAEFVVARRGPVPVGAALGLALLTKGTSYAFAAPYVAWWAVERSVRERWRAAPAIALVGLLAVGLNAGHYARNLKWFGAPLGPGRDGPFVYANERIGILPTLSVAARNVALQIATPWPRVNASLTAATTVLHKWARLSVDDPATTWYGTRFVVGPIRLHEDLVPNGVHLVLMAVSVAAVLLRRRPGRLVIYSLALIAAFLAFSAVFRWQPWHTRLELPLFVLGAPVAGLMMERRRIIGQVTAAGLLGLALLVLIWNESRPLLGQRSVFRADRVAQMFVIRRDLEAPYRAAVAKLTELGCQRLMVWLSMDAAEYPLWVLTGAPWSGVRIEHFRVTPPSAPCAVFTASDSDAPASLAIAGMNYRREVWIPPAVLYMSGP
jgi:hypothetical protein